MVCVHRLSTSQYSFNHIRLLCLCIVFCLCNCIELPWAHAQDTTYTQAELSIQSVDVDLLFDGNLRQTEINSIDIVLREQLANNIDGGLLFGYLIALQNSNPIFAGQDLGGEYIGLDLRIHLINSPRFKMLGRFAYRFNWVDAKIDDQSVEWSWHQSEVTLHTQTYISERLYIGLGASALNIDGVEKARGPTDQNLDFKAKDSLTAHIGLQLELDQSGQIGVELKTGSLLGGRIIFQS